MIPKLDACKPCVLYGKGLGFSYLEGTGASNLMAVAEALGKHEEKDALPLRPYARSGGLFQRVLDDLRIDRDALTITNIVRCRPPNNELLDEPYEREAIDHCAPYLDKAVRDRKPTCILALGAIPIRELAPAYSHLNATAIRGFTLPSRYPGVSVIGTYHPSFIARGAWNLYGVLLRDTARAVEVARNGPMPPLETQYELHPTVDRVREYLAYLRANPHFPIAYDVETPGIYGEKEPTDWRLRRIVQIQFSHRAGYAIVLPYTGEYRVLARAILALPNPKWGWNSRTSDDVVLRADGATLGGETHDLMLAWGHYQPDFAGGKDEHEEKGIPTKLMGLQACASFFCPDILPWKHEIGDVPLYGAKDADYTQRCGVGLFSQLKARGLYEGYMEYKYRLRFVLDDLGARGLPVDRDRQADLAAYVDAESNRINVEIQSLVPIELRGVHPEKGYKVLPKKVKAIVENGYDPLHPPLLEFSNFSGHLVKEPFEVAPWEFEDRWCVRKLFNANSSDQVLAYIKHCDYRVPLHIDTKKETANAAGIDSLVAQYDDPLLKLVQELKKLITIGSRYASGAWVPGDDGRVHATFGMLTGSGQTTAKGPNCQQLFEHYDPNVEWQARLAEKAKSMVRAEPGHLFVQVDMRSFHARMQGWLAEDPIYYRMANFDLHSFTTAHYLKLPDAPLLISMEDEPLRKRLKEVKSAHKYERDYKIKRCTYLMQFAGGPDKMFTILQGAFTHLGEVIELTECIKSLFPRTFHHFPNKIRQQLKSCRIVSPFGCHRFIWDRKQQEGVAYLPANCSHCTIQSALIRLHAQGVFEQYNAVNFAHDSLWLHPKESDVEQAVAAIKAEFEKPSDVLINSLGAFQCAADAKVGPSMIEMRGL